MSASIIQFPTATRQQALWNPPALAELPRWNRAAEYSRYCLQYVTTGDHDDGAWLTTTEDGLQYASIARRSDGGAEEWTGDLTADGAALWYVHPMGGAWGLTCASGGRPERFATLRDALESVVSTLPSREVAPRVVFHR